jgi:hypothetical protein
MSFALATRALSTAGFPFLGWVLLAACSKTPAPEPEQTHASAAPQASVTALAASAAASAGEAHAGVSPTLAPSASAAPSQAELAWDAPPSFAKSPDTNPMRKATYKVAKAAGDDDDAELTVTSAGGSVDANVKRWSGQFGDAKPKTETKTIHGLTVTTVELKGTFAGGGMRGPATSKEHQMLLGAIVDSGGSLTFFKLVGPEKTVTSAHKDFDKLIASVHTKT